MAKNKKNVLIYTLFKLPNRDNFFKWIRLKGLSTEMYLVRPKGRTDIVISTLEDAKKYRTGVTLQTSTHHYLLSQGFEEDVNLFPVTDEMQNILKSDPSERRIDLSTGDRLSLAWWLKEQGLPTDYWQETVFLFQEDFYMAFGLKTSDEVVERVRTAYEELYNEGTITAILQAYVQSF